LTSTKRQAQMVFDKASKTSDLAEQVSILDDKVSSLTAKILHHEECNSFLLGIIESACEMLRCKFPFDLSFSLFVPMLLL
jgi:DNA-binding Xre family transcriptional regulator